MPGARVPRVRQTGPVSLALRTADGVVLHAEEFAGPGPDAVVLAHGFGGSTARAPLRRVAAALARRVPVLAYDARGHGRSTGRSTLGDREVLDVDAAVGEARRRGARRVATVGFSMGAAAVVRHAAGVAAHGRLAERPDAVVVVSGTGPWSTRATATRSMLRLHRLVESAPGRLVARAALGARVDPRGWPVPPESPLDCVARVDAPLLVVHGERDGYLAVGHARQLAAASGAPLWVEDFGHAEVAVPDALLDRLADHLAAVLAGAPAGRS